MKTKQNKSQIFISKIDELIEKNIADDYIPVGYGYYHNRNRNRMKRKVINKYYIHTIYIPIK